ncbi:hypothetical protein QYZ29_21775, partial [Xanthomonas campestris pv. campestris]|nr:hypothetical protein [Xanthomonas campestris pv. campestris]
GEEFVLLLPDSTIFEASAAVIRLQRAPTWCLPPSRMAATVTHTTPLPNRRILCVWSDLTALPHASAAVGARLRAMGRHRDSFIARKRALT